MKKRMLSLALALAMCLGLTVPAFAEENNWDLAVNGESDTAAWTKEKTFTLRSWSFSDYDENYMRTVTQTDTEEFTTNCVCPNKGDVMVITNGGEEFGRLGLMAWSDPDGDGVYDNRLMKGSMIDHPSDDGESPGIAEVTEALLPADIAGPLVSSEPFEGEQWYFNYFGLQINGSIDSGVVDLGYGTELRLSADTLLDEFGPNTLVWISVSENEGWYVFVEDGAAPNGPGTYTAKKYDTWGQIALNHYGTYAVWPALYAANGYKAVKAGMVVTLPEKLGNYTRLPAQVVAEGERLYTVKAGDTLGRIAQAVYGDAMQYKAIFQRNADRLKNVNTIYEGQIIVLPVISK